MMMIMMMIHNDMEMRFDGVMLSNKTKNIVKKTHRRKVGIMMMVMMVMMTMKMTMMMAIQIYVRVIQDLILPKKLLNHED